MNGHRHGGVAETGGAAVAATLMLVGCGGASTGSSAVTATTAISSSDANTSTTALSTAPTTATATASKLVLPGYGSVDVPIGWVVKGGGDAAFPIDAAPSTSSASGVEVERRPGFQSADTCSAAASADASGGFSQVSSKTVTVDGVQTTEYLSTSSAVSSKARYIDVGVFLAGTCYGLVATYRPDVDPSPPAVDVLESVLLTFNPQP